MSQPKAAGGNFDGVAPVYDALSFVVFGRRLQRAQTVFINCIEAGSSVLLVGGGTGWLLEQVLVRCRPGRVLYLESSARMLARASRLMVRKGLVGSVEFRVGNVQSLRTDERFDVVITPFLLDLFTEPTLTQTILPNLQNALKPGGLWLATDFVNTPVWWQKILLWAMIQFFRLTAGIEAQQLANWPQLLAQLGLILVEKKDQIGGMVLAALYKKRI